MAASGDRLGTPLARIRAALDDLPRWLKSLDDVSLGEPLIEIREVIDRSESVFADGCGASTSQESTGPTARFR